MSLASKLDSTKAGLREALPPAVLAGIELVPELRRRGRYKRRYAAGTFREKLFGHARLKAPHPATQFRHPVPETLRREPGTGSS